MIDGYPTGSVRISFGYSSTEDDANKLFDMVLNCFVSKPAIFKLPVTWDDEARILKKKFEPFCQFHSVSPQNSLVLTKTERKSRTLVYAIFSRHYLNYNFIVI